MQQTHTLIIGAGLTGLSCAHHLNSNYLLLERESEPGGVVRTTLRHDAFQCDGTGHWLHLRNPAMRELVNQLLPGQLVEYERRAVIHLKGAFTPYPFQANTYGLPPEVSLDCLLGLLKARHPEDFGLTRPTAPPRHFLDSLERSFGEGICKHFMVPYNEKLLGIKLEEISADYAVRFIPQPSLEDVVKGAFGFSRESLGYNAKFVYPREGGISALPKALARSLPQAPLYNTTVARLNLHTRTATLSNGQEIHFQHLVNTAPLVKFMGMLHDTPPEVGAAASQLRATTVHYFDIGVRGPGAEASHYHWVYFPEPEFVFYRAGSYSAVHAGAAPQGCRSYYVEMSGELGGLRARPQELRERVLADLRRGRMLHEDDEILFMDLCAIPHAYVIFDQHYVAARNQVIQYLEQHDVFTGGRWGGWNYGGMEDALLDGRAAAAWANR